MLLRVRDLSVVLDGRSVVSGTSFDIARAMVVGLAGESGCGKTTLALALMRLLPEDRYRVTGSVEFAGENLLAFSEAEMQRVRGARMSMIFQDPLLSLNPVLRAQTQVAEVIRAHRAKTSCEELFRLVGLEPSRRILRSYPHQLSGGERQRVTLAQALACRPELVIADEPFTALDPPKTLELVQLFRRLRDTLGASFLVISHSAAVLSVLADEMLLMENRCCA